MQRDLSFTGNLCVSFDLDLNGHTLNVSDTLTVIYGDVLVNGGTLNVGSYIQSDGMKLVLNSNNDVKNVHVSESFLIDDWSDLQFGSNVTVNVNTYVTGNHTVLNGPGTNYWAPSNPDTLNGAFAKGIWTENSYCYIEYPIYNVSGTVTEYRRGYVPHANVSESFGTNSYNSTTAYIEDGSVYNLPSTSSQNLGTFVDVVAVEILDEENELYYIEYLYNGTGPSKRGYVEKNRIFQAATGMELTQHELILKVGSTHSLSAIFTPSETKNKELSWVSSDPTIASVSENGKITALDEGIITLTATTVVGGISDSCTVRVVKDLISLGDSLSGSIGSDNLSDDYAFSPTISIFYTITTSDYQNLCLDMYDESGNLLSWITTDKPYITIKVPVGEVYYLRVRGSTPTSTGFYNLKITCEFEELVNANLIDADDIKRTSDGFAMCIKPMAEIVGEIREDAFASEKLNSSYLFTTFSMSGYTYGLIKMADLNRGEKSVVTISFISFTLSKFLDYLNEPGEVNGSALFDEWKKVFSDQDIPYNETILSYFEKPTSDGAYLVAEEYVQKVANCAINGSINVPDEYTNILEEVEFYKEQMEIIPESRSDYENYSRVPNAVSQNNTNACKIICDNSKIYIEDPQNLTSYEKYAILMTHTGNVNFNSFAAEVVFHAEAVTDPILGLLYYDNAVRADMAIECKTTNELKHPYYYLDSDLVEDQIAFHGEQ